MHYIEYLCSSREVRLLSSFTLGTLLLVLVLLFERLGYMDTYQHEEFIQQFTKYEPKAIVKEIYQYGDFWVLTNVLRGQKNDKSHLGTFVMQGYYTDIYSLSQIYYTSEGEYYNAPTSFAVYISDVSKYLKVTMDTLAYARDCMFTIRRTGSRSRTKQKVYYIRDYVNFHIYLRSEQMRHLPDVLALAKNLQHTLGICDAKDVLEHTSEESFDKQQQAIIVGRNIAQMAVHTKFVVCFQPHTFVSRDVFRQMLQAIDANVELFNQTTTTAHGNKIAYLLPVIVKDHLDDTSYVLQSISGLKAYWLHHEAEISFEEYNPNDIMNWRSLKGPAQLNNAAFMTHFANYTTYYLGTPWLPLLPEHFGLSVVESERLRVYEMLLQAFDIFVGPKLFLLQSRDWVECRNNGIVVKRQEIWQDYEKIYGKFDYEESNLTRKKTDIK